MIQAVARRNGGHMRLPRRGNGTCHKSVAPPELLVMFDAGHCIRGSLLMWTFNSICGAPVVKLPSTWSWQKKQVDLCR